MRRTLNWQLPASRLNAPGNTTLIPELNDAGPQVYLLRDTMALGPPWNVDLSQGGFWLVKSTFVCPAAQVATFDAAMFQNPFADTGTGIRLELVRVSEQEALVATGVNHLRSDPVHNTDELNTMSRGKTTTRSVNPSGSYLIEIPHRLWVPNGYMPRYFCTVVNGPAIGGYLFALAEIDNVTPEFS